MTARQQRRLTEAKMKKTNENKEKRLGMVAGAIFIIGGAHISGQMAGVMAWRQRVAVAENSDIGMAA